MTIKPRVGDYRQVGSYDDNRPVYFIQAETGLIKIGVSRDPLKRLRRLQSTSPVPLTLLGILPASGANGEAQIHQRFHTQRRHGEWFHPSQDLLAYIATSAVPLSSAEKQPAGRPTVVLRVERFRGAAYAKGWRTLKDISLGIGVSQATVSRMTREDPSARRLPGTPFVAQVLGAFPNRTFADFFEIVLRDVEGAS